MHRRSFITSPQSFSKCLYELIKLIICLHKKAAKYCYFAAFARFEPQKWSEWRDSNSRHPAPKRLGKIFLLPKRRFSYVLLRKPNFLITIIPLIPTVIFLVLVKYVVKNVERWSGFAPPFLLSALGVYHKTSELSRQLLNLILRACRCHTWTNSPAAALK